MTVYQTEELSPPGPRAYWASGAGHRCEILPLEDFELPPSLLRSFFVFSLSLSLSVFFCPSLLLPLCQKECAYLKVGFRPAWSSSSSLISAHRRLLLGGVAMSSATGDGKGPSSSTKIAADPAVRDSQTPDCRMQACSFQTEISFSCVARSL